MTPAGKATIPRAIDRDMADPGSVPYGAAWAQAAKWTWGAEGSACTAPSDHPADFSSLHTSLGAWFQLLAPAAELLAFVTIDKDAGGG